MPQTTEKRRRTSEPEWAGTAAEWGGRTYQAVLPSGMQVEYRLPSLGEMAALGELPSELLELAYAEWAQPGSAALMAAAPLMALDEKSTDTERAAAEADAQQMAERIANLNRHMIAAGLVAPAMTAEQLEHVPYRDLELLSLLMNRGSGVDSAGRHVGVVPIDQFRLLLEAHGVARCDPGCAACAQTLAAVSQVR
jgi:hypothetical protein